MTEKQNGFLQSGRSRGVVAMRELTVCHTKWQCEIQAPQFLSQKHIFNYDFIKKIAHLRKRPLEVQASKVFIVVFKAAKAPQSNNRAEDMRAKDRADGHNCD